MRVFVYESDAMMTCCKRVIDEGHGIDIPDELVARFEAARDAFEDVEIELAAIAAEANKTERMREKERLQIELAARRKETLAKLRSLQ